MPPPGRDATPEERSDWPSLTGLLLLLCGKRRLELPAADEEPEEWREWWS
ncbi:Hypothetical predicted protein [Pelobates cultripes]|uniref:Uncharacterized protein n=1 Tax=Pelobates cultripes TaxID=61616 RepID=A0AAD1WL90_PELCU|nr:Hypothetical predicted protein [Pelobates cultripes]